MTDNISAAAAAAISSGLPMRLSGTAFMAASSALWFISRVISVSTKPGAMALHVTPRLASSLATVLVRPISPALAEA